MTQTTVTPTRQLFYTHAVLGNQRIYCWTSGSENPPLTSVWKIKTTLLSHLKKAHYQKLPFF